MRDVRTPEELQRIMGEDFPPSAQQWEAIVSPLQPGVVIAGAGSGKTTLMAARVVHLCVTGQVRPEEVLGLTFTTKAAAELRARIRASLRQAGVLPDPARTSRPRGEDPEADLEEVLEPTVLTYNAYAARLLTEHGLRLGHEPDTRVLTDASRYQLGARVVDRFTGEVKRLTDHPATAIQNLLALDGAMSEHLRSPDDVRRVDGEALRSFEAARAEEAAGKARKTYLAAIDAAIDAIERRGELLHLVEGYRRLKRDLGLMDFSDQIELGARLAEEFADVGERERETFRVVMLDEYQDTSVAQARMLGRLFSGDGPASGRGHAVTAVGDPNQAIYGWRGASVANILGFADTFPAGSGRREDVGLHRLTVNRRSQRRVLEVANRLAAPLLAAHPEVLPLEAPEGAGDGAVETHVFETAPAELDWLVEAVRSAGAGSWSDVGVLVRDNAHGEEVFDALTGAGIPVEIVGLSGLLRLPEVAEVVAALHLMHDVTDNAALIALLTGPRWAIGPRDLRLLARRAAELAGGGGDPARQADVAAALVAIADGVDAAEVPALADALDDPGPAAYSSQARERFTLLADELRLLRRHVGEPLLDVVRRIIDLSGVDVELASSVTPAAASRRDNLDLFVRAVADFQAVDGDTTLPALLAYLTAEDEEGNGLDLAVPTAADSVKLLTVHRSKGLEWHTVFCVGVCDTRFPSNRSRSLWTSSPSVLPAPLRGDAADLPQLAGWDKPALDDYRRRTREHDATEELRLGYVAFTRAAQRLAVTSYCWGPRPTPFGPSDYQALVRDLLAEWGEAPGRWQDKPERGDAHPLADQDPSVPWPRPTRGEEVQRRLVAAKAVLARMAPLPRDPPARPEHDDDVETVDEAAVVAGWDDAIDRLLAEARRDHDVEVAVPLPGSLSATALGRLRDDPAGLAADLARPMPRRPAPAARFGTRFHAWVESRLGQQGLFADVDVPGRGDEDIVDDRDLREVIAAFEAGPFGQRAPHAVEAPFALVLAGQVVRGRIDAVYADPDAGPGGGFLVVDWKTGRAEEADPLQLAIYRVAWAELAGVPPERVRAAFHHVRSGRTEEPPDLPDRAALEALLGPGAAGGAG